MRMNRVFYGLRITDNGPISRIWGLWVPCFLTALQVLACPLESSTLLLMTGLGFSLTVEPRPKPDSDGASTRGATAARLKATDEAQMGGQKSVPTLMTKSQRGCLFG